MKKYPVGLALLIMFSCGYIDQPEKCDFIPETESINVQIQFESLEDSLPAIQTKAQLVNFLSRHPSVRDYFFNRQAYPNDSVFINALYQRFTHPAIDTVLVATHQVFGDGKDLKEQFSAAF